MKQRKLKSNRARCGACKQEIESLHMHDWVYCQCGKTFVDGGQEYLRRGYDSGYGYDELSEWLAEFEEIPLPEWPEGV